MPLYVYPAMAVAIILIVIGVIVKVFDWDSPNNTGGTVREKKHCCEEQPEVIIVRFEPLEVNVTVTVISPEPSIKGTLTLGPVSEKKG